MRSFSIILSIVWLALANIAAADDADRLQDPDVRGNFVGAKWYANWETSRRPGRVVIETDPKRVRTGPNSIRLHLKPGDCGKHLNFGEKTSKDTWSDCDFANERVGINPAAKDVKGVQNYGLSIMLDARMSEHLATNNQNTINLYQWQSVPAQGGGPCVNIMLDTHYKKLLIDDRCWTGSYDHGQSRKVYLDGPVFDVWHEFVVTANWSDDKEKGYIKILHNGNLVVGYQGYTLPRGAFAAQESAFIYRYQGMLSDWSTSTVWFDDLIRSWNINAVKKRYDFDETLLRLEDDSTVIRIIGSLKVILPTKSIKEVSYSESFTILDENIGRRFEFSFQNNDGDIIGTTNIYTALNNDVAAINFLITSEAEIGTGSRVTDELKGDLVPVGPHAVLRISDGDQACGGLKYPIFPERIERARVEQALRGVVDILVNNQVPIPKDESDKLRAVIAECFFKLKLGS